MKKIVTFFIFSLFFTCSVIAQTSNAVRLPVQIFNKEGDAISTGFSFYKTGITPVPFWSEVVPSNAVPGMIGFSDYATNGNTLNQVIRIGDTLIVGFNYVDSSEAANANGGITVRMAYNFSFNGGATWESTTRIDISPTKCRWPDLAVVTSGGQRTVAGSGRVWTGTLRAGGVLVEPIFGAGVGTPYYVPGTGQAGNTDYFTDPMLNGQLAGVWQRNDTIYYQKFDPATNTFGPNVFIFHVVVNNASGNTASYDVYASHNSNTICLFDNFVNEGIYGGPYAYPIFRYQKSTDLGATWTTPQQIMTNFMIEGDSAHAYWHQDAAFKPGTDDPYLVFSTIPPIGYGNWNPGGTLLDSNRRGYNICIWSPVLNSGNPVRVASYHNLDVLADTNKFKQVTRIRTIQNVQSFAFQVNSSIVAHPTIGFSTDGSVIHVSFEVAQTDTSSEGFNYYDIYRTSSTDGGSTWSTPLNVTNTPTEDEMYPIISKTVNANTIPNLSYQSTSAPGCQGFGRTGVTGGVESIIIAPVYQCVIPAPPIGIINIGTLIPKQFSMQQNYPNPFNPTTKIRFAVPKAANVTLQVFDITGRLVATLANNESVTAGNKEIEFNASNIASGIYFYRINAGTFTDTKKMILVK